MAWRSLFTGGKPTEGGPPPSAGPSLFGKLPSAPDFLRLGPGGAGFERWLEEGLEALRGRGGALPAAPLGFLLPGLDEGAGGDLVGLMLASRDAVGRTFPVALHRGCGAGAARELLAAWQAHASFRARAQALLVEVAVSAPPREALIARVAGLAPEGDVAPEGAAGVATRPATVSLPARVSDELEAAAAAVGAALAATGQLPGAAAPSTPLPVPAPSPLAAPARASLEAAFGPLGEGGPAHAVATFLAACDAGSAAATRAAPLVTVEAPASVPLLELWLTLAGARLGWPTRPGLIVGADRLVLALAPGPASPALLAAHALSSRAGPRHWLVTTTDGDLRARAQANLPARARAALADGTLANLVEALA